MKFAKTVAMQQGGAGGWRGQRASSVGPFDAHIQVARQQWKQWKLKPMSAGGGTYLQSPQIILCCDGHATRPVRTVTASCVVVALSGSYVHSQQDVLENLSSLQNHRLVLPSSHAGAKTICYLDWPISKCLHLKQNLKVISIIIQLFINAAPSRIIPKSEFRHLESGVDSH